MSVDHSPITDHIDIELVEAWPQERAWGSEILLVQTPAYTLKKLVMHAGYMGGLQKHKLKDEAFTVAKGVCEVHHDTGSGSLTKTMVSEGDTVHIPPGAVHRVLALSDCTLYEASTPVFGDRIHCEKQYGEEVPDDALPDAEPQFSR